MSKENKMISYWAGIKTVFVDDGLVVITGFCKHMNTSTYVKSHGRSLGVHYDNSYSSSRGKIRICALPTTTGNILLSGYLQHSITSNAPIEVIQKLIDAIEFLKADETPPPEEEKNSDYMRCIYDHVNKRVYHIPGSDPFGCIDFTYYDCEMKSDVTMPVKILKDKEIDKFLGIDEHLFLHLCKEYTKYHDVIIGHSLER